MITFGKIKRRLAAFFTRKKRRDRLKGELRKELEAASRKDLKKQLGKRLKEERQNWHRQQGGVAKPKGVVTGDVNGNEVQQGEGKPFAGLIEFLPESSGNIVRFGKGCFFQGSIRVKGTNNLIEFGTQSKIGATMAVGGDGCRVTFGDYSTARKILVVAAGEDIHIGSWCMFSRGIEIRSDDGHAVVDRESGRMINLPKPVFIGDHVWICAGANISKGSRIPSDSIVAAMTFVNQSFEEEGVVLAGIPAKVVKRGITWNRRTRESFTEAELDYRRYDDAGEIILP